MTTEEFVRENMQMQGGTREFWLEIANSFDPEGSDRIGFRDFIAGLSSITQGSTKEKLEWMFKVKLVLVYCARVFAGKIPNPKNINDFVAKSCRYCAGHSLFCISISTLSPPFFNISCTIMMEMVFWIVRKFETL